MRDRNRRQTRSHKTEQGIEYVRREISIEELTQERQDTDPPLSGTHLASETERILQEALRGPMYEALVQALWDCLKKANKVHVIVEIFLNGKTVPELARELSASAGTLQATKARALETLRDCPEMKLVFQDWGA